LKIFKYLELKYKISVGEPLLNVKHFEISYIWIFKLS
jgi:hypothetical protein